MAVRKGLKGLFLLAVSIFIADFLTKAWVQNAFFIEPERFPIVFMPDFFGIKGQITYAVNSGAAWGLFSQFPTLLVLFRVVLIAAMIIYLVGYNERKAWQVPFVCIVSGALGNVSDYFLYGYVVDMIQLSFWGYHYPVFNLADSSIFIGAFWILLLAFFEKEQVGT